LIFAPLPYAALAAILPGHAVNIVDPILFHCRMQAPAAAMCAPGAELPLISYGRLEQFIRNIARNAVAQGLERGNTVVLLIEEPILHAAFVLGLAQCGVATVSAHSAVLPKELKVDAVVADRPHLSGSIGRVILADSKWTEGDPRPAKSFSRGPSGDDVCRIVLTSGTTGNPKAVAFTHHMLIERIARHDWVFGSGLPACDRIFVDPGLSTSIGALFWLYTLSRGGTVFFRGNDAVETLQALSLYRVQAMVAAPAALAELLECYEGAPAFTTDLRVILSVGGLLHRSLSERARARLCTNLFACYGSTEANVVATAPSHTIVQTPGAVGYVTPGVTVQIVDRAGDRLPAGEEGRVRIRGRFTVDAYLGDPEESRAAFQDGWFYPGDLGSLSEDDLLVLSGRENTVLNLGGEKVGPERIEAVLLAFPGITQAAAFSIPDELGVEVLHAAIVSPSIDEAALRAHCERHLPTRFLPAHFLATASIPRNQMGKVDRRRLSEMVRGRSQ
jgi:acyl-CoA synthetase (AMP-forming)/AMP-acid ligase II